APPEKGQMERIVGFLQDFTVQGMTPLAASLEQAQNDFVYDASRVNSIVMLSDGIETCGGDPCQLVEELKAEGINFTVHVIGLDVDDETRQQLSCIAEAGGGTYHDAQNQQDLVAALSAVKGDVTQDEMVAPADVDTSTPALPTPTPTLVPPTPLPTTTLAPPTSTSIATPVPPPPTPAPGVGSTMISEKDGMEMVYVPAGEFLMGSPEGQGNEYEWPQHTVYLNAYWIDKTEVTVAQYSRCVEAGACSPARPDPNSSYCTSVDDTKFNHPINCVDWSQAVAYCGWVGRRLPSEAEWEKAARGVDGRLYPWGNQEPRSDLLNFDASVDSITTPVGQYPAGASPYGALDMAGNVWEMVADWYDENYYRSSPPDNPQGPDGGDYRVLRGGSWVNASAYVRTADRFWAPPYNAYDGAGFRCVHSS
ncbi:MAG: SUMF1/EgtB/PvdO family nonheme iron enzyme, partial [Anaerolineae bacterium]|nr:SUMF1/EgtB/PvdO family nonheme iron enzyme [Anaerolineae bacterium]